MYILEGEKHPWGNVAWFWVTKCSQEEQENIYTISKCILCNTTAVSIWTINSPPLHFLFFLGWLVLVFPTWHQSSHFSLLLSFCCSFFFLVVDDDIDTSIIAISYTTHIYRHTRHVVLAIEPGDRMSSPQFAEASQNPNDRCESVIFFLFLFFREIIGGKRNERTKRNENWKGDGGRYIRNSLTLCNLLQKNGI